MSVFTNPISAAIQRGDVSPQLRRQVARFNPQSGFTFDQSFDGFSIRQMEQEAVKYANSGCEYTLTWEHGKATMETTDTRGATAVDSWEVVHSETLISSFSNPRNIAAINVTDLAFMSYCVDVGGGLSESNLAAFNEDPQLTALYGFASAVTDPKALRFWERRAIFKQDSIFYDLYSVRHTCVVSNRWPFNIAEQNRGCLYTPSQFYSEVQNTDDWLFPMPQALVNLLESSTVPDGPGVNFANHSYYLFGFLKGGSPRCTGPNNTSTITTEYRQSLWSTDEYATL